MCEVIADESGEEFLVGLDVPLEPEALEVAPDARLGGDAVEGAHEGDTAAVAPARLVEAKKPAGLSLAVAGKEGARLGVGLASRELLKEQRPLEFFGV